MCSQVVAEEAEKPLHNSRVGHSSTTLRISDQHCCSCEMDNNLLHLHYFAWSGMPADVPAVGEFLPVGEGGGLGDMGGEGGGFILQHL